MIQVGEGVCLWMRQKAVSGQGKIVMRVLIFSEDLLQGWILLLLVSGVRIHHKALALSDESLFCISSVSVLTGSM